MPQAIVVDLKLSTTEGIWIGTAYLLANTVTMPLLAEASNIFGRPVILTACLISFTFGSVLCSVAYDIALLLVGRTFQGIGGAGIMVLSLVIFTDVVPLRFRPKWYGLVLGAWALGNCLGPVTGGIIAQKTTWRWVFYIMFPFCALGLGLVLRFVTLRAAPATLRDRMERIDWLGGLLFIASSTLLLIAISWGGSMYSWFSAGTVVPLCLGVLGLGSTFIYEARFATRPFLRRSLFWATSAIVTYACGLIQGFVIYGQLYYIPLYFLSVKSYTPIQTGLATLPIMVTLVPGSIAIGAIVTHTANYCWPIRVGWALVTTASGLSLVFDKDTPVALWAIILVILGLGHGAVLNAQNFAAQAQRSTQTKQSKWDSPA
ncbi:major facilitator superfamily domain-containing protein [Diaporthe sp. PMI_573]|nr:major facilitator superfamily domain-containing protein [Diaporthaceae sp. PMI_573]